MRTQRHAPRCSQLRLALLVLPLLAAGCGDGPVEPGVLESPLPGPSLAVLPDAPVIAAGNAYFNIYAYDLGGPTDWVAPSLNPLVSFSDTARTDFARSAVKVTVSPDGPTQVISVKDSLRIEEGGTEAGVSFAIRFEVMEEVTYEIYGRALVDVFGEHSVPVQVVTGLQFNALSPWDVLHFEGDNTLVARPGDRVESSINGVNEGSIGGGTTSFGSRTGVLQPGLYGLDGHLDIFGRSGGFNAIGGGEIAIRLTATAPRGPTVKQDCFDGGWAAFGFRNQGQCVRFVETGKDSR